MSVSLGHLTSQDYQHVYEPSEDTFYFTDAITKDLTLLRDLQPRIVLEIGSGSGAIITHLASLLGPNTLYLATDVNPKAAIATKATAKANQVTVEVVQTAFASGLQERIKGCVDVLLFNPPYVPTPHEELVAAWHAVAAGGDCIAAAWAGGVDGREILDRFLPQVKELLSPRGCFYLVAVQDNNPKDIADRLAQDRFNCQAISGRHCVADLYCWQVVLKKAAANEMLYILRFQRPQPQ